jgi:hypothetical protein
LAKEASSISWLLFLELGLFNSFSISSTGISLKDYDDDKEQNHQCHLSIKNIGLPCHEFEHFWINSDMLIASDYVDS